MLKKCYYIFLISVCFHSNKSFSQSYIPMINDSMYWDASYAIFGWPCSEYGPVGPFRYKLQGDTVINSITYRNCIAYEFFTFTLPKCPPFYVDTIYAITDHFIREDTIAERVYRYNVTNGQDELLFDFSLQQGDSIYLPADLFSDIYFYADTVYNIITADGLARKYIECFQHPWQGTIGGYMIEGIGGAMGPFMRPYNIFEQGYWLMCFSNLNQFPIYGHMNSNFNCFSFTTGINEPQDESLLFMPNPASTTITISNISNGSIVKIMNLQGSIVMKTIMDGNGQVNVSLLTPGIYLMSLTGNYETRYFKFIKE